MSGPAPTLDEALLLLLADQGPLGAADLAAGLGTGDRTVRRRLRRLIRDGYVFSPEWGRYRITAAGLAVLTPVDLKSSRWMTDLLERWRKTR